MHSSGNPLTKTLKDFLFKNLKNTNKAAGGKMSGNYRIVEMSKLKTFF